VKKKGIARLTEGGILNGEEVVTLFTQKSGKMGFQQGRSGREARRSVRASIFVIGGKFGVA
jgi:hypothetical protein